MPLFTQVRGRVILGSSSVSARSIHPRFIAVLYSSGLKHMKPIIVSAIISSGGTVVAALIAAWSVRSVRGGDGGGDGRQTTQAGTSQGPPAPESPLLAEERPSEEAEERPSEDFERERETQRGRLAIVLVFILLAVVLVSVWYVLTAASAPGGQFPTIPAIIGSLLAPLVGLVGAVTGFYYGAQSADQGSQTATQAAESATQAATQAARRQTSPGQTSRGQPGPEQPGPDD